MPPLNLGKHHNRVNHTQARPTLGLTSNHGLPYTPLPLIVGLPISLGLTPKQGIAHTRLALILGYTAYGSPLPWASGMPWANPQTRDQPYQTNPYPELYRI